MNIASEYKQQFGWRAWPEVLDALPPIRGQVVLDLGCAVGDQAAELVARGARVIGVDLNPTLIEEARSRKLPNTDFRQLDLRTRPDLGVVADGVWCSFAASYFPDLPTILATWSRYLRPGGWIALTEVDDLFGNHPLSASTKGILEDYARNALAAKWYDFHMGHKLGDALERSGFKVNSMRTVIDQELSFDGPARAEVIEAWRKRFDRMTRLRNFCGQGFAQVCDEFLCCLSRPDHWSSARVYCSTAGKCVAKKARTSEE